MGKELRIDTNLNRIGDLRWASFKTLDELQIKLGQLLAELTPEIIAGITGYPFILDALSVINTI
jgi:putative transposase